MYVLTILSIKLSRKKENHSLAYPVPVFYALDKVIVKKHVRDVLVPSMMLCIMWHL